MEVISKDADKQIERQTGTKKNKRENKERCPKIIKRKINLIELVINYVLGSSAVILKP